MKTPGLRNPRPTKLFGKAPGLSSRTTGFATDEADYDYEVDAGEELDDSRRAFRERAAKEQERFAAVTDSEFWVAVCFATREHKEAFLAALYLHDDKYVNGHELARQLGIDLPSIGKPSCARPPSSKLTALALPVRSRQR